MLSYQIKIWEVDIFGLFHSKVLQDSLAINLTYLHYEAHDFVLLADLGLFYFLIKQKDH
jgi:hypothetical protein